MRSFESHILKRIKEVKEYPGEGDQGSWGMGNYVSQDFLTHTWPHGILDTLRRHRALGLEKCGGYGILSILCGREAGNTDQA